MTKISNMIQHLSNVIIPNIKLFLDRVPTVWHVTKFKFAFEWVCLSKTFELVVTLKCTWQSPKLESFWFWKLLVDSSLVRYNLNSHSILIQVSVTKMKSNLIRILDLIQWPGSTSATILEFVLKLSFVISYAHYTNIL